MMGSISMYLAVALRTTDPLAHDLLYTISDRTANRGARVLEPGKHKYFGVYTGWSYDRSNYVAGGTIAEWCLGVGEVGH